MSVKQAIITILLTFATLNVNAQTQVPNGIYKLSEIIHQDGKHLETQIRLQSATTL